MPTLADIIAVFDRISKNSEEFDRRMKEEAAKRAEEEAKRDAKRAEEEAKRDAKRAEEEARRDAEFESWRKEWKEQSKALYKKVGTLDYNIGEFSENMIRNGLSKKFKKLGYPEKRTSFDVSFRIPGSHEIASEIDFLYESTDTVILVEFKTTLAIEDVKKHIDRIEKYRLCIDADGDKRAIMGAVHGAVVGKGANEFALESGLYVLEHSGNSIQIIEPGKGKLRKW